MKYTADSAMNLSNHLSVTANATDGLLPATDEAPSLKDTDVLDCDEGWDEDEQDDDDDDDDREEEEWEKVDDVWGHRATVRCFRPSMSPRPLDAGRQKRTSRRELLVQLL